MASTASLYESDFHQWASRTAEMLRAGTVEESELGHIAEEIESLGISQRRELLGRVRILSDPSAEMAVPAGPALGELANHHQRPTPGNSGPARPDAQSPACARGWACEDRLEE